MTVIADVDNESNNLATEYTGSQTDSGDIAITAAAALAGTSYGLAVTVDDTNQIYAYVDTTQITTGKFRARIYLDPNTIPMDNGEEIRYFFLQTTAIANVAFLTILYNAGYRLIASIYNDAAGATATTAVTVTDAPHYVEVYVQRATNSTSNDGRIDFWIDGANQQTIAGVDNYDRFANFQYITIGAYSFSGAPGSGTFYLDQLVANDDGSEIGPVGGSTYEDALSLSKQGAFTLNSISTIGSSLSLIRNENVILNAIQTLNGLIATGKVLGISTVSDAVYSTAFTLSKQINLFTVSELGIIEVALSLAKNLSISLSKTSAYAIDDVILEWTTQVLNVYNEAFSLSKIENVSLSSILTAEGSVSLNRRLAISLLTNIVQSVTIDLANSLNISLLSGADYSDTLSLSKQLSISLSEIKSIEMAFALGKQLSVSTIANAVYLASVSLAKTLNLSTISSATYETAISLIRDLAVILDATVTGSAQTYEEAFALSKTLSVTKSTLLDAIEAITLARSLAISVSASMISNENFALGKQLSISLLSGLLLDSALSLIRDEALTTNKTLILNENIGLVEYRAISDSALAEMAVQLSLGKSVSISANATLILEEDITLGKILAIQLSGGKVFDDAFVLSILQAIATASSVILFVGQIPAKLVINDQTVWLVSAHDNLVSDDIIETDISQSDIIIKDVDHV